MSGVENSNNKAKQKENKTSDVFQEEFLKEATGQAPKHTGRLSESSSSSQYRSWRFSPV